jgi:Peptidase family S41
MSTLLVLLTAVLAGGAGVEPPAVDPFSADVLSVGVKSFAVITLRSPPDTRRDWEGLDEAIEGLAKADALLLDVRDFSGGSDSAPLRKLRRRFPVPVAMVVKADCPEGCRPVFQPFQRHPRARLFHSPAALDEALAWLVEITGAGVRSVADFTIPTPMRDAENRRLRALGLKLPRGGLVPERPFAPPLNRRSYLVPQRWLQRHTPKLVFAPALREDLVALRTVMQTAYGGWEIAAQHGWDWDRWFKAWAARLEAAGPAWVDTAQAFEPVRALQQFQLDNHTTIPLGLRFGSGSASGLLHRAPAGPCLALRARDGKEFPVNLRDPAQQPRAVRHFDGTSLRPGHYLAFPASRGDVTAVRCGSEWIGVTPAAFPTGADRAARLAELAPRALDRPHLRHLTPELAYLRLPAFTKENTEIIERERSRWDRPSGKERVLIVDLRGNEGGDAAFSALDGWVDPGELEAASDFNQRSGASCLYHPLRWGYTSASSTDLRPPLTPLMRGELQSSLDVLFAADDTTCTPRFKTVSTGRAYKDRTAAGQARKGKPLLMLVVDGECGSDCEFMTFTLAKLSETVVVGVNTYGVMQYIQPGYSVLPNTRLPFRVALGTSDIYGDNRSADGYGLDVDVLINGPGAWSRAGILRLAALLAGVNAW